MAYKRNGSLKEMYSKYRIPSVTLYRWVEKFEREGLEGLKDSKTWKRYSKELKESAVRDYLSGEYSLYELVRKYRISSKAYLSAILDLYDGSIISYVVGRSNNNQLVFETLDTAIGQLEGEHPLIHSDRGYQYTSYGFKHRMDEAGMAHSMSRVGKCIDNGPIESFWGTLKCEKYYLHKYETFEELTKAIDEYIYFYNNERYQERLNGLSPSEYRAKAA